MFLAAGTVAWTATFAPWAISQSRRDRIFELLDGCYRGADYDVEGWWRVALLTAAGDQLDRARLSELQRTAAVGAMTLTRNVDHHNSSLRDCIYQALSFTAPSIRWESEEGAEMRRRVRSYVEKRYLSAGWPVVIALAMRGDLAAKRTWLADLLSVDGSDRPLVAELLEKGSCYNPAAAWMLKITGHTASALLTSKPVERRPEQAIFHGMFAESVESGVSGHPLMGTRFALPLP